MSQCIQGALYITKKKKKKNVRQMIVIIIMTFSKAEIQLYEVVTTETKKMSQNL